MPIIKSAKKRVRVARKAAVRNSKTKRSLKDALKMFHKSTGDKKKSAEAQGKAQSALDKAVKKGVIHKNKAARTKRKLAAKAKTSAVANKAATTKKPATKKPTSK
jgi:small subunit ribosomal protein S20